MMIQKLLFVFSLIVLISFSGCTVKPPQETDPTGSIEEVQDEVGDEKPINREGYLAVDYNMLMNSEGKLQMGDKVFVEGILFPNDGIRMYYVDCNQYVDYIKLPTGETVAYMLMDYEFDTPAEMNNYNFDRIDELREKDGVFYLTYLGVDHEKPICILDKVLIERNIYNRDYFDASSNTNGSWYLPAKIDQFIEYDSYLNSQYIVLREVLKGEDAIKSLVDFDKDNIRRLEEMNIVLVKFEIFNTGEALSINRWDFKYANESFVGDYNNPVNIIFQNELDFTIYDQKSADGWIVFEVDEEDKEGYAIYKDKLWFKLY